MKRLALLPTICGALLIFENGTAHPPTVELTPEDVAWLEQTCAEFIAWRAGANANSESVTPCAPTNV